MSQIEISLKRTMEQYGLQFLNVIDCQIEIQNAKLKPQPDSYLRTVNGVRCKITPIQDEIIDVVVRMKVKAS